MAESHPYISGSGNIAKMVGHLRKSFPQTITSDTVKKLGLASNNESHLINALQFISIIADDGKKTTEAANVFSHHKDDEFSQEFSKLVKKAYSALFDLYGDTAWTLSIDDLITFFRKSDSTSDAIGKRQANVFKVFAALSGHGEIPEMKQGSSNSGKANPSKSKATIQSKKKIEAVKEDQESGRQKDIGLTVRIEINLPANGSKETYDNIFKSIKENLMNG